MKTKKFASVLLVLMLSMAFVFAGGSKEETTTSSNTLKVAMECDYAPYNWTQTTDANGAVRISGSTEYAYGYDVMMAKLIAEKLGKNLEIVKLDWDSLVPAVQSGTVDCVIAGQSITSDRLQMVDFTTPYYYASIVCLVNEGSKYEGAKGVGDLKGAVCTSQQNTVWYDVCLPQIENANILPAQESAPAMLVALSAGRVDLICTDSEDNFVVSQEEINIGISVSKNNPELTAAINEVLATLTVEDFNAMMDEAISVQPLSN